ncbi:hypothetical protein [Brachybacterium sacelli]|uniref:Uncharacterized protein n=1 Tax=Brachybacterium sacelli TaxID=173364 RepID=A0ABS4WXB1_9MICO|nr:hypothetical protein [Brachybacterium sacelli]MBP2380830.1 hypothetical protein [Brachybacterium sacelli]
MTANRRIAVVLGAALVLLLAMSTIARAEGTEQVVQGRYLELLSVTSDGAENLSPGDTMRWAVKVSAPDVEDGTISRALVVGGALAEHVEVSVEACASRPTSTECAGGRTLLEDRGATSGQSYDLGTQAATDQKWLLVQVRLRADAPQSAQARAGTLSLQARGAGEGLGVSPGGGTGGGSDGGSADESEGSPGATDGAATGSNGSAGGSPKPTAGSGTSTGGSTGSDGSTGGFDSSTTGVADNTTDDQVPRGFLAATGMAVAVWLLAAAAFLLLGAALRRGRLALTTKDEHDKDSRP